MKKTILTLAIAVLSGGISSIAQTTQSSQQTQATECAANGKDCKKDAKCDKRNKKDKCKGDRKCDRKGHKGDRKGGKRGEWSGTNVCRNLFEGIQLTPDQQQKIEKIRETTKSDLAKVKSDAREDRQKVMDRSKKDIEKVLTAEQRVQYEANLKAAEAQRDAKKGIRNAENRIGRAYNAAKDSTVNTFNRAGQDVRKEARKLRHDGKKVMKKVDATFRQSNPRQENK